MRVRFCGECGAELSSLDGARYCPECGAPSPGQMAECAPSGEARSPQQEPSSPFLGKWRTSVGLSVLGAFLNLGFTHFTNRFAEMGIYGMYIVFYAFFGILYVTYALAVYRRLFGAKPPMRSAAAVSFMNCLAGGIVFGPLWNNNLTKGNRGISYVVFATLYALGLVAVIACAAYAI